jgi:hypothetical protein
MYSHEAEKHRKDRHTQPKKDTKDVKATQDCVLASLKQLAGLVNPSHLTSKVLLLKLLTPKKRLK